MGNLEYYKRLPYSLRTEMIVEGDNSSYWTAEYVELRGCKADGDTEAEAVENLYDLFDEYIAAHLEMNSDIPEPAPLLEFGDSDVLRIPSPKRAVQLKLFSVDRRKFEITDEQRRTAEQDTDTREDLTYQGYKQEKVDSYIPA